MEGDSVYIIGMDRFGEIVERDGDLFKVQPYGSTETLWTPIFNLQWQDDEGDEPDVNDDFPMYLEYEGLHGNYEYMEHYDNDPFDY